MSTLYRGEADDAVMAARPFVAELHRFDAGPASNRAADRAPSSEESITDATATPENIAKREEC
jgi:hypothetical protein